MFNVKKKIHMNMICEAIDFMTEICIMLLVQVIIPSLCSRII